MTKDEEIMGAGKTFEILETDIRCAPDWKDSIHVHALIFMLCYVMLCYVISRASTCHVYPWISCLLFVCFFFWKDFDAISGIGDNFVLYTNVKKASQNSLRLMKFVLDHLCTRRKEMVSMLANLKSQADRIQKRINQEKLREQKDQAKLDARLAAKANGSPSKGISIAGTQNVGKVDADGKTAEPIWGHIRRFVHGHVKSNIG